jgi:hypothetical protein
LCGCASLAAGGGFATRTPCAFASLGGLGLVGQLAHLFGLGWAVGSAAWGGLGSWLTCLGWVGQLARRLGVGWAVGSAAWVGLGSWLGGLGWVGRLAHLFGVGWAGGSAPVAGWLGCVVAFVGSLTAGVWEDAGVKGSGSMWFGYGVVVLVTFGVGLLAFAVWVLSKVF